MSVSIKCGAIVDGCPGELKAATETELLGMVAQHAADAHGLTSIDDATMTKVKAAIQQG